MPAKAQLVYPTPVIASTEYICILSEEYKYLFYEEINPPPPRQA